MNYSMMSLGMLLAALKLHGDQPVRGLGKRIFSYRGYYERMDLAPSFESGDWEGTYLASDLVKAYESQLGGTMTGYKGGDFTIREDEAVYCAGYGNTGPAIVGLVERDGVVMPVLCECEWW